MTENRCNAAQPAIALTPAATPLLRTLLEVPGSDVMFVQPCG